VRGLWAAARRRRGATASTAAVSAFSTALVGLAIAYPGSPIARVDLNDGGVWVTNAALSLLGHLNVQATEFDGGLRATSNDFDVVQRDRDVVLADFGSGLLSAVDVASVALDSSADLPSGAHVRMGGGTIAVTDGGDRRLWVVPSADVRAFDATQVDPDATFRGPATVTVGVDGTVWAAVPAEGVLYEVGVGAPRRHPLDVATEAEVDVTTVGARVVVLDRSAGRLLVDGERPTPLDGAGDAVLQQPGADDDAVLVATRDALVSLPLDGSSAERVPAGGTGEPAAPVRLSGCSYAAWSGSARYVRDCDGTDLDVARDIPDSARGELRFRVNRDVVVLNDTSSGSVWLTDQQMTRVDNWDDVTPPPDEAEGDDAAESTEEPTVADRSDENRPPSAVDDAFGVRPGRTTVLPVLDNDSDPDGDLLTVVADSQPQLGAVAAVRQDEAFQLSVPDDAQGLSRFAYTASDGRGGEASAQITLEVHPWGVNDAPEQLRTPTLVVSQGESATLDVLGSFRDPDGDTMFLQAATATSDDEVSFTPDGRVTFRDVGTSSGVKAVSLLVSDGTDVGEGVLQVEVRTSGNQPPVAVADHVSTLVGTPVTVHPLVNDTDADGDELRLAKVDERTDLTVAGDFDAGTVTLTAAKAGTAYVTYVVSDGPEQATGLIRLDVTEPTKDALPPVAVHDVALLPAGGEVYVDPTANDVDPTGGLLVVQSADLPDGSPLQVAVIDHHLLRIAASSSLTAAASLTYTVANGAGTATGEVVVLPVPAPPTQRPPTAVDDTAVVRVGDVVTIPVLANDASPNGDTLTVAHDLAEEPESGAAFVAGSTVRFEAPDEAGTVHLVYSAVDSMGQSDAAHVTITVRPLDAEHNAPPQPRAASARVLLGARARIPVLLDGIDPDGDSVTLVGLGSAPSKGRVVTVGESWLEYEAARDASGVDEFTYLVEDRLGARAEGTVRVGLAPASGTNQAPVAVADEVTALPGRHLAVAVVTNDLDPDGDELTLVDGSLETDAQVSPTVVGDRVELTTPPSAATVVVYYQVTDGVTTSVGALTVRVDPVAHPQPPTARDDVVRVEDAVGAAQVTVGVLDNDEDPDGAAADLTVSSSAAGVVVNDDRTLTIPVTGERRVVRYAVTDADGLVGQAFVWLPSALDHTPRLAASASYEVVSGETLRIELTDAVVVLPGRSARVTTAASVAAQHADGAPLLVDENTLAFTSAPDYVGPASVTFEVTDGSGPDDPEGATAVLTVPITVLPAEDDNQPPTFTSRTVEVAPGEEAATVDLAALTTDPDEGDLAAMTYRLMGAPGSGLDATVDGHTLSVSAGVDVHKGTTVSVDVELDDHTNPPVTGTVTVTVVASRRPLAVAVDDVVDDARQGRTSRVDVLANDTSPFPGKPLALEGAPVVESGTGTVTVSGGSVMVTPAADFVGTMVVRYRVSDATKDPDRVVDGRVRLTVRGRPAAPGTPTVDEVRSRTVVLSWRAPSDHGAPITGYTVSAATRTWDCATTTCTIDGLTNDQEYRFTVVATNAVGVSDASPRSAAARPDERPSAPSAPTLVFGDGAVDVAWAAPTGYEGSPVSTYTLEVSPAPPSGSPQRGRLTATTLTWDGLENGVAYRFRVQAVNRAPEPSDFSAWSATVVPAGVPDAPAAPTTTRLDPVGAQAQLQVSWAAPADNGDAVSGYTLHVRRGGTEVTSVRTTKPTATIALDTSESDYTFTVDATNKAGTSAVSAPSLARRAFVAPGPVGEVVAVPGDGEVRVTHGTASGNGAKASELTYQLQLNGGAWAAVPAGGVVGGLTNGETVAVGVRAVTTIDGVTYEGPVTTADGVVPFGPPRTPGASAKGNATSVTLSWTAPARNGRDFHLEISVDGGGWQDVGAGGGSKTVGDAYSERHSIRVRTVDTEGQVSPEATAEATSGPRPTPTITLSKGGAYNGTSMQYLVATTSNLPAGTYRYQCFANGKAFSYDDNTTIPPATGTFPANGNVELRGCWVGTGVGSITVKVYDVPGFGTVTSAARSW